MRNIVEQMLLHHVGLDLAARPKLAPIAYRLGGMFQAAGVAYWKLALKGYAHQDMSDEDIINRLYDYLARTFERDRKDAIASLSQQTTA